MTFTAEDLYAASPDIIGEAERFLAQKYAGDNIQDFEVITSSGKRFSPLTSTEIHKKSPVGLEATLAEKFHGPTVVMSHHATSALSVAPRIKSDPVSPAFASRLESLIEEVSPTLWIHGHTHDAFN